MFPLNVKDDGKKKNVDIIVTASLLRIIMGTDNKKKTLKKIYFSFTRISLLCALSLCLYINQIAML